MNALLKVLCLTLNERLKNYLYKMNIINKAQRGLKAGTNGILLDIN